MTPLPKFHRRSSIGDTTFHELRGEDGGQGYVSREWDEPSETSHRFFTPSNLYERGDFHDHKSVDG